MNDSTLVVRLEDIEPNPWNPHRMTEQEMADLIASLKEDGQWRPIVVIEMDVPDEETPTVSSPYRIIDGEHLYKALYAIYLEGGKPTAKVMVYGKNSQVPAWKQKLIGQTINHGLRGSIEDPRKTEKLLSDILKHRTPETVARRLGVGTDGIRHVQDSSIKRSQLPGSFTTVGIRSSDYQERKAYITALSFDDPKRQKEFNDLIDQLGPFVVDPDEYVGRAGQYRVQVVMEALRAAVDAQAEKE